MDKLLLMSVSLPPFEIYSLFQAANFLLIEKVVRTPSECSKGGQISFSLRRFSIVIEDLGLKDLPLQGSYFTHAAGYDLKDLGAETVTIVPSLVWISS